MTDLNFYKDKKILITGHTGFKGAWLCRMLMQAGADITGYALMPPTKPSMFALCKLKKGINSIQGDIRDYKHLIQVFEDVQPEIVIHMAAQPIVRESYRDPLYTYWTNTMGTVNVLECVRLTDSVKSFLNVTTDKVYRNEEKREGYREDDRLGGYDPYSNSKACSELVTAGYVSSFLKGRQVAVSTARAGNVIGGGDFARDRIIPDCVRAVEQGTDIVVRNPASTRPYQHVLEPLAAYLMICQRQYENPKLAGNYNVGPDDIDCLSTGELVTLFCDTYNRYVNEKTGADENLHWINKSDNGPHETNFLKLDCTKLKETFGWHPRWHIEDAVQKIVEWEYARMHGEDILACMDRQIQEYLE